MTRRLRPGWLVALFAAIVSASAWMPWVTATDGGRGWISAMGGTHGRWEHLPQGFGVGQLILLLSSTLLVAGAVVGRGLSVRLASIAALAVSLLIVALTVLYYKRYVNPDIRAEYGLYIGAGAAICAVLCSLWAVAAALASGRRL